MEYVEYLKIEDTTSLSLVNDYKVVEILELENVTVESLSELTSLESLEFLKVYSSVIADFSAIARIVGLKMLHVQYANLKQLGFLEDMELDDLHLRGVPLEADWLERAADLVRLKPILPDEVELRLTRALFDHGVPAAFDTRYNTVMLLGYPKPFGVSGFRILPEWLDEALEKPDFSMEALVERRDEFEDRLWEIEEAKRAAEEAARGPRPSTESFDFGRYMEVGDSKAALSWVASSDLAEEDKQRLSRFVRRFRQLDFFRYSSTVFEPLEKSLLVSFPKHIRDQLTTLVLPRGHYEFYFKASRRRNNARDAEFSRMRWWMHPKGEADSAWREPGHHETGHFVVGHCPSYQWDMSLCHDPKLGGGEVRWYYPGDLLRPFSECQQIFDSYADMLDNVREIFDRDANKTIKPKKL